MLSTDKVGCERHLKNIIFKFNVNKFTISKTLLYKDQNEGGYK